jgi:flagellar biosynthesis protein FlhB
MAEKNLPPSAKRLRKARREGKTAKSRLLGQAAGWVAAMIVAPLSLANVGRQAVDQWTLVMTFGPELALKEGLLTGFWLVGAIIGAVALAVIAITVAETRFLVSFGLLVPDAQRISPLRWVDRVKSGSVEAVMGIIRCIVVFMVLYPVFRACIEACGALMWLPAESVMPALYMFVESLALRCSALLVVMGAIAYGYAHFRFMRQHRMSLEEAREEYKEDEGDPHMKSARRHEHEAMILSELARRVRSAKVIVVSRVPER